MKFCWWLSGFSQELQKAVRRSSYHTMDAVDGHRVMHKCVQPPKGFCMFLFGPPDGCTWNAYGLPYRWPTWTRNMNCQLEYGDIPFHLLKPKAPLEDALEMCGVSRDMALDLVTCHISGRSWTFPGAFYAFIKLLYCVNMELTCTWSMENKKDQGYWISLRAYLNDLLENTLTALEKNQRPMALRCWLHREFMLCRHDEAGRKEYLKLMKKKRIRPYSVDIFEFGEMFVLSHLLVMIHPHACLYFYFSDWLTWWEAQREHGYYKLCHFERFARQLKADWKIIKEAASSELWNSMEEHESNGILSFHFCAPSSSCLYSHPNRFRFSSPQPSYATWWWSHFIKFTIHDPPRIGSWTRPPT